MFFLAAHLQWDIHLLHGSIPQKVYGEGAQSVTSDLFHGRWALWGCHSNAVDEHANQKKAYLSSCVCNLFWVSAQWHINDIHESINKLLWWARQTLGRQNCSSTCLASSSGPFISVGVETLPHKWKGLGTRLVHARHITKQIKHALLCNIEFVRLVTKNSARG